VADAMAKVTLPEMGESVAEGSIVEWRKNVGDFVAEGDPLVDVTTDKVDVEVPATASGVVTQVYGAAGDTVAVGAVLAEIDTSKRQATPANGKAASSNGSNQAAGPQTSKLIDVTLPEMGESVTQGTVVEYRVRPGQVVAEGDTIVEVTTDKVDADVPAPARGVVVELSVAPGATVAVGAKLAVLDTSAAPQAGPPLPRTSPAAPEKTSAIAPRAPGIPVVASAQALRIARKLDLDLSSIRGSGPDGLIVRADVNAQAGGARRKGNALPAAAPVPAGAKLTPIKGPAAALTSYMEQSLTIPTATTFRTLSVTTLDARRRELNGAIKAAGRSEKISFTHLVAFALIRAAAEMPFITYSFRRDDSGMPQRLEPGIHLGLAVDVERKDGSRFLMVPVIRNADALDFAAF
jgi:2-oxoglutarate decarboxylase